MSVRDFLRVLRKRWRLIVAGILVCVAASMVYVYTTTKMYRATAQVFVSTSAADVPTAADLAQGNAFAAARVQSYTSVANSPSVTNAVVQQPGINLTSGQLAGEISADAPLNKVLINLHVTDRSPALAARLANAVAAQFISVVEALEQKNRASSPVGLTVIHPANPPGSPITPRTKTDIGIGVLLGVIVGIALAFGRDALDNTVKEPAELADQSSLPVLGVIPWDKTAPEKPISFRADSHGTRAESFRQMRTNLQFVDVDNPPKVIAITSARPGEGKTHTALNLAAALAETGQRVCLVEADLRKPSLAKLLGVIGDAGLTSVLIGRARLDEVVQSVADRLTVLTSGPVPPNPSELLVSGQFRSLLTEIADSVDIVIIDTAPLLPVADGAELAALADATLLTVRAAKTTREQVRRAIETLDNVGVVPVGAILSMAPRHRGGGYTYYYEEYRPNRPGHSKRVRAIKNRVSNDGAGTAPTPAVNDFSITDEPRLMGQSARSEPPLPTTTPLS